MKRFILFFVLALIPIAQSQLANYHSSEVSKILKLEKELNEISGIALSEEGKLFAHGDEEGKIYQLDLSTGKILKEFEIGDKDVEEDFEDIAIVGKTFYLVSSKGDLYEFLEGDDGEEVEYKKYETSLKSKYDVEGLCYDPTRNTLLLACKEFAGKEFDDCRTVYEFDIELEKLIMQPRFVISLNKIEDNWNISKFKPSAIIRHPKSGTFFILGGKGLRIIELTPEGRLLSQMKLDKDYHHQPEGIVIQSDLTMIISDEADKGKATLTFYPYLNNEK